jgi:hypothetical protein
MVVARKTAMAIDLMGLLFILFSTKTLGLNPNAYFRGRASRASPKTGLTVDFPPPRSNEKATATG